MDALFISLLTLVLLLISAFIVLIVLMQRTSQSGGMGAALGGGAAESAFGADTNNVLTKGTIYGIIAFFVVGLGLYLFYQARAADANESVDTTTLISALPEEAIAADEAEEGVAAESAVEAAASVEMETAADAEAKPATVPTVK
ncbi:MAG: preprotein translocase subunit SecG [Puniceicoccaceae bacterium MED-G30]|nr:MAG: preprotein translocase subunit SecG [Puniceicoccaceae bacterium MED-G30]RPG87228.1 MAG: preprotein translocase subunit SecG [Coraliomargarita sp. TMED73]